MRRLPLGSLALVLAAALGACGVASGTTDEVPRDRYGYRVGSDPSRETVFLQPVADSSDALVYPAVVDSVAVRPAGRPMTGDGVAVEVLVQGALPDACASLSGIDQNRQLRFVSVDLTMRTPRERVCAAVVRPFRFYFLLDGTYEAGSYTLTLNGSAYPFQVLPARTPETGDGDAG